MEELCLGGGFAIGFANLQTVSAWLTDLGIVFVVGMHIDTDVSEIYTIHKKPLTESLTYL